MAGEQYGLSGSGIEDASLPNILSHESHRPPWWNRQTNQIRIRAVLARSPQALGLRRIVVGDVMDFVAGVQPLHDLQCPLACAGGRVKKVRFDLQDSHTTWMLLADPT